MEVKLHLTGFVGDVLCFAWLSFRWYCA